jgi:copper transport protein
MKRWGAIPILLLLGSLGISAHTEAHALLQRSLPDGGAVLQQAPQSITLTFTEQPEPTLSVIHVLDSAGRQVDRSGTQVVPGHPEELQVPLGPLQNGAYTVTWRTVSRIDGHVTGGAFGFGIGVSPPSPPSPQGGSPWPSSLYVLSRWGLYVGLSGLLGAAWVWTLATHEPPGGTQGYLWGLWTLASAGVITLGVAQAIDAGVGVGRLLGTPLGRTLWWRALPISIAGAAIAAMGDLPPRSRRIPFLILGLTSLGAVLAHTLASHAGAGPGPWRWPNIVDQWVHFSSVGVWMGGLAALLVAVRGVADERKAVAVRRFSTGAGIALGVVAVTGILRAVDEVGAWSALFSTDFGRVVLLKVGLLIVLAVLGAINRFRTVPAILKTLQGLRRVGGAELAVAALVLAVTGLLTGLAPPSLSRGTTAVSSPAEATASDYATSVRVHLEAMPGFPGANRFIAQVLDYDTRRPIKADRVALRFTSPDRPDIGASTLELQRAGDGTYQGQGANMSLEGPWLVTAVIERQSVSVEVPLAMTARSRSQPVQTIKTPGQPTLYNIDLSNGRLLDAYLDPGKPGLNELHLTFIAGQSEISIPAPAKVTAARPRGAPRVLPVRRFGPGHFIVDAQLGAGDWQIEVTATTAAGETLRARFTAHL